MVKKYLSFTMILLLIMAVTITGCENARSKREMEKENNTEINDKSDVSIADDKDNGVSGDSKDTNLTDNDILDVENSDSKDNSLVNNQKDNESVTDDKKEEVAEGIIGTEVENTEDDKKTEELLNDYKVDILSEGKVRIKPNMKELEEAETAWTLINNWGYEEYASEEFHDYSIEFLGYEGGITLAEIYRIPSKYKFTSDMYVLVDNSSSSMFRNDVIDALTRVYGDATVSDDGGIISWTNDKTSWRIEMGTNVNNETNTTRFQFYMYHTDKLDDKKWELYPDLGVLEDTNSVEELARKMSGYNCDYYEGTFVYRVSILGYEGELWASDYSTTGYMLEVRVNNYESNHDKMIKKFATEFDKFGDEVYYDGSSRKWVLKEGWTVVMSEGADLVYKREMPEVEDDWYYESEFIFPYSDSSFLTDYEVSILSKEELRIARNEIYARHGRIFASDDLREYFNSKSWYYGLYESAEFDKKIKLNKYEKENIKMIQKYEQ